MEPSKVSVMNNMHESLFFNLIASDLIEAEISYPESRAGCNGASILGISCQNHKIYTHTQMNSDDIFHIFKGF